MSHGHLASWPAGQPAVMLSKNSNVKQYTQTVSTNVFTTALFIGTIDIYHFILLLLTLTLPGGHKVSTNQNILASSFRRLFV